MISQETLKSLLFHAWYKFFCEAYLILLIDKLDDL
jgi:hypothetical protein